MYFKEIELAGFKSFADKIDIKFDNGITAIVGPNGCGKSNVGDAIRWVLGEQSSKSLRGTSMQDVIFSGTEKRKSLSYCEVSLHFNNVDKFFPVEYEELIVTRKLYRNGDSEYQINRNQCRLKDIVNLFYDSGIGRDGYSIIGQGKVEEIISSKPEVRRSIFEEATGIAKYKSRKVEAERKLEKTRENLTRLRDIVGELERQLGPLKNQAETAKKYLELTFLLKDLEVNAYIYQYDNAGFAREDINKKMNGILEELSIRQSEIVGLNQKYNNCLEDMGSIDSKIKDLNNEILKLTVGIEKQSGETKLLQERVNNLKGQNQKIESDILNYENSVAKNNAEKEFKQKRKLELEQQAQKIEASSGEYSKIVTEYGNLKVLESNCTREIADSQNKLSDLNASIQVTENRRRILSELQADYEGYGYTIKKLLKESEKNNFINDKIIGVVANLIKVPEKYETAIEIALGSAVQNVVTSNEDNAKILIKYLKDNQFGRATFMPISSMKPRFLSSEDKRLINSRGCFGVASQLVEYDAKIYNVIENLLGSTVVVDTLENAVILAKSSRFSFKIVTLEGDVINPTGSMTGGSKKTNTTNLISRDREISDLATKIENLKVDYQNIKNIIQNLTIKLANTQKALEELDKKKNSTQMTEAVQIAEIRTEINAIENDFKRIDSQNIDSQSMIKVYRKQLSDNNDFIAEEEEKINKLFSSSTNLEAKGKLEAVHAEQAKLENDKAKKQQILGEVNVEKERVSENINQINAKKYRLEGDLAKIDNDLNVMQERIYEEYNLTYHTCLDLKRPDFKFEGCITEINKLKRQINALGPVNVNAIEDSKAVLGRYEEMHEQVVDLEGAEADTLKAIQELAAEMSEKFTTGFDQINENFKITFRELFGGGNAKLELVGSDDVLEAGVDIVAEPPGKQLKNITLLSGGEKALTAIAILFAILKLKPMPFCLLDEIEAALDEANVDRFAQYLHRFADETQFIVVTHRKPTMELADSLYGVTMEEKGVSKIVSVKLSEAVKNVKEQEELKEDGNV